MVLELVPHLVGEDQSVQVYRGITCSAGPMNPDGNTPVQRPRGSPAQLQPAGFGFGHLAIRSIVVPPTL